MDFSLFSVIVHLFLEYRESTCSPSWLDAGSLPALLKSPPISFPYSFTEDDSDYEKDSGDNDEDFSEEL